MAELEVLKSATPAVDQTTLDEMEKEKANLLIYIAAKDELILKLEERVSSLEKDEAALREEKDGVAVKLQAQIDASGAIMADLEGLKIEKQALEKSSREEIDLLTEEKTKLIAALTGRDAELESRDRDFEDDKSRILKTLAEADSLNNEQEISIAIKDKKIAEMTSNIESLESLIQLKEDELRGLRETESRREAETRSLNEKVAELTGELTGVGSQLELSKVLVTECQNDKNIFVAEIEKLRAKIDLQAEEYEKMESTFKNKLEAELQKALEDKKRIMSESSAKDAEILRLKDEVQRLEDTETKLRQRFLTDTTKSEPSLSSSPATQAQTQASDMPRASLIIYVVVSIFIGLVLAKVLL